jgi:hypothetical protein
LEGLLDRKRGEEERRGGANYRFIVCIVPLPSSKDSLRKILVVCYVIGIPTTESLSLNLTVTEEKMGG